METLIKDDETGISLLNYSPCGEIGLFNCMFLFTVFDVINGFYEP